MKENFSNNPLDKKSNNTNQYYSTPYQINNNFHLNNKIHQQNIYQHQITNPMMMNPSYNFYYQNSNYNFNNQFQINPNINMPYQIKQNQHTITNNNQFKSQHEIINQNLNEYTNNTNGNNINYFQQKNLNITQYINPNFYFKNNNPIKINPFQKPNTLSDNLNNINNNSYSSKKFGNDNDERNENYGFNVFPKQKIQDSSQKNKNVDEEEIEKWIQSRKRNFPTSKRIEEVKLNGKVKEEKGILSKLELKLREKIKVISKIDKKGFNRNRTTINFRKTPQMHQNQNKGEINDIRRRKRNKNKKHNSNKKQKEFILQKDDDIEDGEIKEEDFNIECSESRIQKEKKEIQIKTKENLIPFTKRNYYVYRRNTLYDDLIKSERIKELNILLQSFRYFLDENII